MVIIGIVVWGGIYTALNPEPELTAGAKDNTMRNAFISGCKPEVLKLDAFTEADAESYCGCGYETLLTMYPDFNDNEDRTNRIINEGYTQTETDAFIKCMPEDLAQ